MQKILKILTLGLALVLSIPAYAETPAGLLVYKVWEPGLEPYFSRILVTPDYLRIDEGGASDGGYSLYDRSTKVIYNISTEDHSVMVINPPAKKPGVPYDLNLTETVAPEKDAPLISGRQPVQVALFTNGQECSRLVAVDGLMGAALEGLMEFRMALGHVQRSMLEVMPSADAEDVCELSDLIYAPERGLAHGLPIQEKTAKKSQSLVDFNPAYMADDGLFGLPEDYRRFNFPLM